MWKMCTYLQTQHPNALFRTLLAASDRKSSHITLRGKWALLTLITQESGVLWLPAHQIQRFQGCCWNSRFSSRGSVFLCSVSCFRHSDNKAACGFRFTFFFFFPSQSYQEEENVPFLTECSNISPGVGIPGWHGVLELKVQLAKSLLSLELLLLTMVHMHQ